MVEFSRRVKLYLNTPAELAIYNAMQEVEKLDADIRLTTVVTMLSTAKDILSDYIDSSRFIGVEFNDDVREELRIEGIKYRVVESDGIPRIVTCDYDFKRHNITLKNNIITKITTG